MYMYLFKLSFTNVLLPSRLGGGGGGGVKEGFLFTIMPVPGHCFLRLVSMSQYRGNHFHFHGKISLVYY